MHRNADDFLFEMCNGFNAVRADEAEIRKRLVALEAADPSQQRPKKKSCVWDRVAFMEWESEEDLAIVHWPWPREMQA